MCQTVEAFVSLGMLRDEEEDNLQDSGCEGL